jgi:D-alanyl-D-alanine carboxypeptidase
VDDETKFLRGLFTGRLVSAKWLKEMENQGSFGYGLGLFSFPAPCVPGGVVWGHNGTVYGYSSLVVSTPDGRTQVAGATTLTFDQDNKAYSALNDALASALCG